MREIASLTHNSPDKNSDAAESQTEQHQLCFPVERMRRQLLPNDAVDIAYRLVGQETEDKFGGKGHVYGDRG